MWLGGAFKACHGASQEEGADLTWWGHEIAPSKGSFLVFDRVSMDFEGILKAFAWFLKVFALFSIGPGHCALAERAAREPEELVGHWAAGSTQRCDAWNVELIYNSVYIRI